MKITPIKIHHILPLSATNWDMFILFGEKRQRMHLRALLAWFVLQGILPSTLSQFIFDQAYATNLVGVTHIYSRDQLRYALNSFAVVVNDILGVYFSIAPLLTKIPGPQALQQQAKEAFRSQFETCLASYLLSRAKKRKGMVHLSLEEENGLFNCAASMQACGIQITTLFDLTVRSNVTVLMDWCDANPSDARTVQMMTVIGHLADQAGLPATRSRVLAKARPLRTDSHLEATKIRILASYAGTERFSDLVYSLKHVLDQEKYFTVETSRSPLSFVSAVATLLAIFAPATLETLHSARFNGEIRRGSLGQRPTLAVHNGLDNLERPVPEGISLYIDMIYAKYSYNDKGPSSMFSDVNGEVRSRPLVVSSIETLLLKIGVGLTVHDLRDLGVAQALAAGDTFTTIATAARMSTRATRDRFTNLAQTIKDTKRGWEK